MMADSADPNTLIESISYSLQLARIEKKIILSQVLISNWLHQLSKKGIPKKSMAEIKIVPQNLRGGNSV